MKQLLIGILTFAFSGFYGFSQDSKTDNEKVNEPKATIEFSKMVHHYGEIEYLSDGTCTFEFTNTGSEPIVVTNVRSSCGCTVPQWTKDPVKPGEKGEITVKYNTRLAGGFNKTITVTSTGQPNPIVLRISGKVKPQSTPEIKQ